MINIQQSLHLADHFLSTKLSRQEISSVLSACLKKPLLDIICEKKHSLSFFQFIRWLLILWRLRRGCPLAYIVNYRYFYDIAFFVNKHTLIPRPESELLVSECLKIKTKQKMEVLDMGCGCGCIGLAIKKNRPQWAVTLVDVSKQALDVAKKNAKKLFLSNQGITFVHSNLFHQIQLDSHKQYHIILANLPYVTNADWHECEDSVRRFEPKSALYCAQPRQFYKNVFSQASTVLTSDGWIMLELSPTLVRLLQPICQDYFYKTKVVCDNLKRERFLRLMYPKP